MIEIKNCPSTLSDGFNTYSPKAALRLFGDRNTNPFLDFEIEEFLDSGKTAEAMHRISVSGVQEKFPAVVDNGKIRIAEDDEQSTLILKPAPWDNTLRDRKQIPANEHLTMQIAAQVYGIQVADNGLCFTPKGRPVYVTRRFDIQADGTKYPLEDFASMIGRSEATEGRLFKYSGSYEDIAIALRKNVAAWMVDMERFFDLLVFNYIYANGDAHLKNFSLIRTKDDYRLAPAYDLINTNLHIDSDDFALNGGLSPLMEPSDMMSKTGHPCRLDFERFGNQIGLIGKRINNILEKYMTLPDTAIQLISKSFLSDKMKRYYLRTIKERTSRFVRTSE